MPSVERKMATPVARAELFVQLKSISVVDAGTAAHIAPAESARVVAGNNHGIRGRVIAGIGIRPVRSVICDRGSISSAMIRLRENPSHRPRNSQSPKLPTLSVPS